MVVSRCVHALRHGCMPATSRDMLTPIGLATEGTLGRVAELIAIRHFIAPQGYKSPVQGGLPFGISKCCMSNVAVAYGAVSHRLDALPRLVIYTGGIRISKAEPLMHVFMEVAGKVFKAPRSGVIAHCIARAMFTEPWVRMTARRTRGKGVWDLGGRKCPPCSRQLCTLSINCGINTDTTLALF